MMNCYTDYSKYKFEDFLSDDFFIQSIKNPTIESDEFWNELLSSDTISAIDYHRAKAFLESIDVEKKELTTIELSQMYQEFETMLEKQNKSHAVKKKLLLYGRVACIIVFLYAGFHLLNNKQEDSNIIQIAQSLKPNSDTDNISLKVSDAEEISILQDDPHIRYSEDGLLQIDSEEEVITKDLNKKDAKVYNQLYVPKGKRSTLILADGTKVWLNAGTRVVYPATFVDKTREIYVDGEVFLDVKKDTDKPFIVNTRDLNVKVRGTSFNVKAYEQEDRTNVVLTEGSVVINTQKGSAILEPNQMFSILNGQESIEKVDPEYYILWKTGSYRFRSEKLSQVLTVFSNYYGITIDCSPKVGALICSGRLNLKDDITQVLNGLCKMLDVEWELIDNKYVLKTKKQE